MVGIQSLKAFQYRAYYYLNIPSVKSDKNALKRCKQFAEGFDFISIDSQDMSSQSRLKLIPFAIQLL